MPRVHRAKSGFTLIEILLATAITALIVVLLMHIFSATATTWTHAEQRTDAFREARAALESMDRDLRNAVPAPKPSASPDPSPPMLVLNFDPNTASQDQVNEEIYMISSHPNSGKSDLCTIGYHCVWNATTKCYVLRRIFKDSDATFAAFKKAASDVPMTFADLYTYSALIDDSSAATQTPPADEEDVASYIWDLTFRPCVNNTLSTSYPKTSYSSVFPLWIEIRFKAVGASAVNKLKTLPITRSTWETPNDPLFKNTILPYSQQFVMRVKLVTSTSGSSTP